jgi:hypothetical protein
MDSNQGIGIKEWIDIAWKHFHLHSQQRVQFFNFFVVFTTILCSAMLGVLQSEIVEIGFVGIVVGFLQGFLGFLFWKIDERNRALIKHAENVISAYEKSFPESFGKGGMLFSDENDKTIEICRELKHRFPYTPVYSHGKSYKILFIVTMLLGGGWIAASGIKIFQSGDKGNVNRIEIRVSDETARSFLELLKNVD